MKKVLVLSYYFRPCNHSVAHRANGWADYLKEFGYYPIILTRNWEVPLKEAKDYFIPTGEKIKHEQFDNYEVYYLPYEPTMREKRYARMRHNWLKPFYFALFLLEMVLEKWSNKFISGSNIYDFAEKYLKENKDIDKVLVTVQPYNFFKFGYLLHQKTEIDWLADYQDDWTTNELQQSGFANKVINWFNKFYEKKWVNTANCVTSVTPLYLSRVEALIKPKKSKVLYLGFEENAQLKPIINKERFTIAYGGTLYPDQNIEIFVEALKQLTDEFPNAKIEVVFIGAAYNKKGVKRLEKLFEGKEQYLVMTERLSADEYMGYLLGAEVLLLAAYGPFKGILPTKLYEYLFCSKPILFCPSDEDLIEDILVKAQSPYNFNTVEECQRQLEKWYKEWERTGTLSVELDKDYIQQFSRRNQAEKLAELLN